jgi:heat shock protein HslJ
MKYTTILILIVFGYCMANAQNQSLTETKWKLVKLGMDKKVVPADASKEPFVKFGNDKSISGNTGCNEIMGTYETSGDDGIAISAGMTKMFCADGIDVENGLMDALKKADRYSINAGRLTLSKGRYNLASFEADVPKEILLENTLWVMKELIGKPITNPGTNGNEYTLKFTANNEVSAQICNIISGEYEKQGNVIKIKPGVSTKMECDDMETEYIFKEMLELVKSYVIKDNTLLLMNGRIKLASFEVKK